MTHKKKEENQAKSQEKSNTKKSKTSAPSKDRETHYMYVLKCVDNSLYTGYTNQLEKRIATHNSGKGAKYTRARRPVELFYYETYSTKQEAMSAEALFKKKTRQAKLNYIADQKKDR